MRLSIGLSANRSVRPLVGFSICLSVDLAYVKNKEIQYQSHFFYVTIIDRGGILASLLKVLPIRRSVRLSDFEVNQLFPTN